MRAELIAGQPFVRHAGKSRPIAEAHAELHRQTGELEAAEKQAVAALEAARRDLASALVTGQGIDREAIQKAETHLAGIREHLQAAREQAGDLRRQHASVIAKATTTRIAADFAALSRSYDSALRRLAP